MQNQLRRALRFRALEPARHLADHALARLSGEPTELRLLVASDDVVYTSEQQLAPLRRERAALRTELGVVAAHLLIDDVLALPSALLRRYDAVLLKLAFTRPKVEALDLVRTIRSRLGAGAKIVYMDGDDDLCVLWPELLAHVDLYVKKQTFAEPTEHTRGRVGKTNLTDHVARAFGTSFASDRIPRTEGVEDEHLHKIVVGWNIALDDTIGALHRALGGSSLSYPKDVDVVCRATVSPSTWTHPLRAPVIEALRRMPMTCAVLTPERRVPREEYLTEMRRSRICVSPFGYGELCWRDFEAILSGSLLVKPDVGHLCTEPNVFVPYVTYVPVRWDYADLGDVLDHYLGNDDERRRICRNALRVLTDYYEHGGFVRSVARVLASAGCPTRSLVRRAPGPAAARTRARLTLVSGARA